MKVINLTQGFICVVSNEDFTRLSKYAWRVSHSKGKGRKYGEPYAATTIKGKKFYMHRLIMKNPVGKIVDHINNQTLDNRRENLRIVSHKENMRNRIDRKLKFSKK